MFLVGVAMFGIILYTPLFVQGVLGRTATGSGAVLTPLVLTMTVMGIVGGQVLARLRRVRPLLLFGTGMMAVGAFLLTRLGVETSVTTVALYLFITALGLGTIMPTTTIAVQTAVDQRELGVATSATQFIRSIGSTVGTALIGTFVTSGYVRGLNAGSLAGVPPELLQTVERPDALVSPEALEGLSAAAANLPNGQALVEQLLQVARASLADSLYVGFMVVFVAAALAVGAALLMPDVRIDKQQVVPAPPEAASADGSAAVGVQAVGAAQTDEPEREVAVKR
jgi:MFS family permease